MKNYILMVLAVVLFSACSSKDSTEPNFACMQDGVVAPKWTCDAYQEGKITAVGIAKMNAGNDKSFQRNEALADGRDTLASNISIKVSNLFKSYKGTTGSGVNATYDKTSSKVSKQIASETLNGSRAIDSWRHPVTKELYLLVSIDNGNVKNSMKKAIKTSFGNKEALYQRFLASEAKKELDFELSK